MQGRKIIVTGGRSGIGAACVQALSTLGVRVASLDRSSTDDERRPGVVQWLCDVTKSDEVAAVVGEAAAAMEGVDGLVQCAGITRDGMLWKLDDESWDEVLDVNLGGTFRVLRAAVPFMRKAGSGSVVNVSSINGLRGKLGQANYTASKAGVCGLTKTAARELGRFDIRVNAVAPGMVRTAMTSALPSDVVTRAIEETALGKLAEPDAVADVVVFLLSNLSRHVTGQILSVDGGQYM
ncbi:MAG: SDR family oxidoreductase [Planctomycetes bacterium]|nr:SDR family oxidoreductase [Planctomycetota bacterium]